MRCTTPYTTRGIACTSVDCLDVLYKCIPSTVLGAGQPFRHKSRLSSQRSDQHSRRSCSGTWRLPISKPRSHPSATEATLQTKTRKLDACPSDCQTTYAVIRYGQQGVNCPKPRCGLARSTGVADVFEGSCCVLCVALPVIRPFGELEQGSKSGMQHTPARPKHARSQPTKQEQAGSGALTLAANNIQAGSSYVTAPGVQQAGQLSQVAQATNRVPVAKDPGRWNLPIQGSLATFGSGSRAWPAWMTSHGYTTREGRPGQSWLRAWP